MSNCLYPLPLPRTLPAPRWLYAWSLPLFLLLTLSLPLPASPSHPSDEKEHSSHFPRNISAASLGSLVTHHHNANHAHQPEPSVTDPLMGGGHPTGETDIHIDMEKNDVQVRLSNLRALSSVCECVNVRRQQKEPAVVSGMHRSKSKHELKLLEKIPENAEATVVLVGQLSLVTTSGIITNGYFTARLCRSSLQAAWTSWSSPPWRLCGCRRRWSWSPFWRFPCQSDSSLSCWVLPTPAWTTTRSDAPSPHSCLTRWADVLRGYYL